MEQVMAEQDVKHDHVGVGAGLVVPLIAGLEVQGEIVEDVIAGADVEGPELYPLAVEVVAVRADARERNGSRGEDALHLSVRRRPLAEDDHQGQYRCPHPRTHSLTHRRYLM